jgi:uncharacterized membrane protein
MRKTQILLSLCILVIAITLALAPASAQTVPGPVARAVLFYSPTCGHCQIVITEVLVPMLETYGDQLIILGVDVSQPGGGMLFTQALDYFELPPERGVVPTLIMGETLLQGSGDIPEQFPGMVTAALAAEGTDWPAFPGMQDALPPEQTGTEPEESGDSGESTPAPTLTPGSQTALPAATEPPAAPPTLVPNPLSSAGGPIDIREGVTEGPPPDPIGFTLGGLVLVGLVGSIGATTRWLGQSRRRLPDLRLPPDLLTGYAQSAWILVLSLTGLGISGYLAYVEVNQIEAVCGPVGACNLVQGSAYAQILGVPIAVLGLAFYVAVIVLWFALRSASLPLPTRQLAGLALVALAVAGTIFSIYLTGVELFVIRAICLWCLSSAVLTGVLLAGLGRPLGKLDWKV